MKLLTWSIESSLCDYYDAYILATGNITATPNNEVTQVVFKNCAPFEKCRTEINETFIDEATHINITMPMYNLIEYSDNYSNNSGSLWHFKRDEITNNADVTNDDNAHSFKHKASLIGDTGNNGRKSSYKKYFLPRVKIDNYNIEIDGRNFYDQPINNSVKHYNEVRKISTGQGDDYTTGCLLDYFYFRKKYRLIAAALSKQKALDTDSRAIQQPFLLVK